MSTSTNSPAPASSTPASTSFTAEMKGCPVELFLLYRRGKISGVDRDEDNGSTLIKFSADGLVSSGNNWRMETEQGLTFHGDVKVEETSTMKASIEVKDNEVLACRCCTELGVPTPPFSQSTEGMKIRFSEPDPYIIDATVLEVEMFSTLIVVDLEMTGVPPYAARNGDRLMLRSGLVTWEANVVYFGARRNPSEDEGSGLNLENKIRIHVRDDNVPQVPKSFPHTKIFVRPAGAPLAHMNIGHHQGREISQRKRRLFTREENKANQKKIKVALHGYRDVGRVLARVALDSEDVDLVAINDPSITDQVSCMFEDSKCGFEVKSNSSSSLLFGEKEVTFYKESDSEAVLGHMASTKLVVTSRNSSKEEVAAEKKFASDCQTSVSTVSGPLEMILDTRNSSNTFVYSWAPILRIRPISASDAKAVNICFPHWRGESVESVVRFQGNHVIFHLEKYSDYLVLPTSTEPSIDFTQLVRWCFHMLSRIPHAVCDVEMSVRPRRGSR